MKHILNFSLSILIIGTTSHNWCTMNQIVVTNPLRTDGFGAQFQTIIYSVMYAELMNKKYVYTPFQAMEHNYDNNSNYLAQKEWLINFIDNFECNNDEAAQIDVSSLIHFFESNIPKCLETQALTKIKKIFRENKNEEQYFPQGTFNIAIHIRRPNSHDSRLMGADTPDMLFFNVIKELRAIYAERSPIFHLYSQGTIDSFKAFEADDVLLHINESVEDTFIPMVYADVLVTSPSSLSYTAAILSEGIIYYIPFWHLPLPHWVSADNL